MTRTVLIAALHREVSALVADKGWQCDSRPHPQGVSVWTSDKAVVVFAGMGEQRAAMAVEAALTTGPVSELISVGWAGACVAGAEVGSVVQPSTVVNVQTGERYPCLRGDGSVLATVASFAGQNEKLRLNQTYNATTVEMEAAAVARLAQIHGLPFRAIKAISDASDFEFPAITRFYTSDGQFREAAFGFYVALRPNLWRPVLQMAKGSKLAAEHLCAEIRRQI
jgi:adenosylhomocysteine nucleosidase